MKTTVPPIKCQGIKTKLVPLIRASLPEAKGRWIEPFCGSAVVALNLRPQRALLTDTNKHIIVFYQAVQGGEITPASVRAHLREEGARLEREGEAHYYRIRERFNHTPTPLDFLFLNRACFNGVMRFNRLGHFNVPFCRKPDRFRPAYISKIANQVRAFADIAMSLDWRFEVADFRQTLAQAAPEDFIYADPPYAGRHVDYYNTWTEDDERHLVGALKALPCAFLLSTWQSNEYRTNESIQNHWHDGRFWVSTYEHFYHVGPTERLRNPMTEAVVANYPLPHAGHRIRMQDLEPNDDYEQPNLWEAPAS